MREKLGDRSLKGTIKISCKFDDGTVRYWDTTKEETITRIRYIVAKYMKDGYVLTLRQLHYQFVANNWIVNHTSAYAKLGDIVDDCRYAGIIDWDGIEDRGRTPYIPYSADDLADGLSDLKNQYRLNRQEGQANYIELWTEKDALSGILRRSTEKYHIQLVVNKGYTSSSAIYGAYKRIAKQIADGKKVTVLYFGDHDPSGLDMVRDIRERLTLFLTRGESLREYNSDFYKKVDLWWEENKHTVYGIADEGYIDSDDVYNLLGDHASEEKVERSEDNFECGKIHWYLDEHKYFQITPIGLTMEQIKQYKLPANPSKVTDPRAKAYIKKFGKISWEVDALEPHVLTAIVEKHIEEQIDMKLYKEIMKLEKRDKDNIAEMIEKYIWE